MGSTYALTNSSETVTDSYLYDAWGNPLSSSGSTINPFRWVGNVGYYFDDETGLFYIRARVYQPTIARWTSVDPLFYMLARSGIIGLGSKGAIGYPDGSCLYGVVRARVLLMVDPNGLFWIPPDLVYPTPPVIVDIPLFPGTIGVIPSKKNKKCIFVLEPYLKGDLGEIEDSNGGVVIEGVSDPNVIPETIAKTGCCEIQILGHQGAPVSVGGATAKDGQGNKTPILPSPDGSVEKKIRDALKRNGCFGCFIFFFTCGGGDQEKQDQVRDGIAEATGCTVFGPKIQPWPYRPIVEEEQYCEMNNKKWYTEPWEGCLAIPVPMKRYNPKEKPIEHDYW